MNQPLQEQGKGFLRALFDFSFTSYITPKIIKVIFGIVIVVAGLVWLAGTILSFKANVVLGIVYLIIFGPLVFLLTVIIYRVYLEVVMAVFTIADNSTRIARGTGGVQGGPTAFQGGPASYPGGPPPAYAGDPSGGYQPPPSWAPTQTADPSGAWTPPPTAGSAPPWTAPPPADPSTPPAQWPGTPSGPPPPQPPPG